MSAKKQAAIVAAFPAAYIATGGVFGNEATLAAATAFCAGARSAHGPRKTAGPITLQYVIL
jgi:hypothetical protein